VEPTQQATRYLSHIPLAFKEHNTSYGMTG